MKIIKTKIYMLIMLVCFISKFTYASTIQDISFSELPGERAEIRLTFDSPPSEPSGYTIEKPARIVLDFDQVENALSQKKYPMSVGKVDSSVVVSGGGRTRIIVNLNDYVPYSTRIEGNQIVLAVGAEVNSSNSFVSSGAATSPSITQPLATKTTRPAGSAVTNIDFRRGEAGEGKVIIALSNPKVNVDIEEVSNGVEVRFHQTQISQGLVRTLDVIDFATPVKLLSSKQDSAGVLINVEASGDYDYLAYQADDEYVISVKPLTQREIEDKKRRFAYVGERLSLNFQDIQVRNVLQLIADFTELNLVASDTVTGSITLRLENVPWDQALDIVLKTKGLDKRTEGNVLMVAPAAEIAERERQEIETKKQLEELAPLRTEYIRIRYANASEMFRLFVGNGQGGGAGGANGQEVGAGEQATTGSILSDRGRAIVDDRTNSIILTDTEEKIAEFKELVERVDIPIRQVMIEARIVSANNDFRRELGFRIAGDAATTSNNGGRLFEFTGRLEGLQNDSGVGGPGQIFVDSDGDGVSDGTRNLVNSNLVDLGVFQPAGAISWNVISSNFLLGMELSALEDTGFIEIVSQPKIITGDKQAAVISSGTQIAFIAAGGEDAEIEFEDALLELEVTPQITPDNKVIMDLVISQDTVGQLIGGQPSIDRTRLESQVLVSDGETVVLGGIYQSETINGVTKVPLLGDIPFIGRLFRNTVKSEAKSELLLFITPRIMAQDIIN